jgi:hypothetical protein
MELTAVIRALEALKRPSDVDLHTDSQYVKNGIETWIHAWKKNGWKTSDKKPSRMPTFGASWTRSPPARHPLALGQRSQRPRRQRAR